MLLQFFERVRVTMDICTKISLNGVMFDEKQERKKREHKGMSLLEFPDNYVVFDLETTGFDSQYDDILEIAAIRVENEKIVDKFSTLVNPEHPIDEFITDLTGITDNMVKDAPAIETVLPQFLSFVGNSVLVGHNVGFDIRFIYDFCEFANLPPLSNDYVDTMRISRKLYRDEQRHRLCDLVKRFGIEASISHRALADVEQTNQCFQYMKHYVDENGVRLVQRHGSRWKAKDIVAETADFDDDSPIYGRSFIFTGTLSRMTRKDAMQFVANHGGICHDTVKKDTNFLVLGINDYRKLNGVKSNKQKKAEQLQRNGNDIEIISENVFYDMLSM